MLLMPENDHDWVNRTMYICLLRKPIELYQSTTYFVVFLISLQFFTNGMDTADHVYVTKSVVYTSWLITDIYTKRSPHVLN